MLLIDCEVKKNCPAGANLAEVAEVGKQRVQLSNRQWGDRPVFSGMYTLGMPLGEGFQPVPAPLDLKAGDVVRVTAAAPQDMREVFDVRRDGAIIWSAQTVPA